MMLQLRAAGLGGYRSVSSSSFPFFLGFLSKGNGGKVSVFSRLRGFGEERERRRVGRL